MYKLANIINGVNRIKPGYFSYCNMPGFMLIGGDTTQKNIFINKLYGPSENYVLDFGNYMKQIVMNCDWENRKGVELADRYVMCGQSYKKINVSEFNKKGAEFLNILDVGEDYSNNDYANEVVYRSILGGRNGIIIFVGSSGTMGGSDGGDFAKALKFMPTWYDLRKVILVFSQPVMDLRILDILDHGLYGLTKNNTFVIGSSSKIANKYPGNVGIANIKQAILKRQNRIFMEDYVEEVKRDLGNLKYIYVNGNELLQENIDKLLWEIKVFEGDVTIL
jgi:hypothetical protein